MTEVERVKTFERWKSLVRGAPKKYQIRMHNINDEAVTFSLMEFGEFHAVKVSLYQFGSETYSSGFAYRFGPVKTWSIIEFLPFWDLRVKRFPGFLAMSVDLKFSFEEFNRSMREFLKQIPNRTRKDDLKDQIFENETLAFQHELPKTIRRSENQPTQQGGLSE